MDSTWPAARPLLKWPGGKGRELGEIGRFLPPTITGFIEPFLGGGAVLFAMPASIPAQANDTSGDLIRLYQCLQGDELASVQDAIRAMSGAWASLGQVRIGSEQGDTLLAQDAGRACQPLSTLDELLPGMVADHARKELRRKRQALARFATAPGGARDGNGTALLSSALKAAMYYAVREAYNRAPPGLSRSTMFWFIRDFCYGSMFRTNGAGHLNVPYGGMSYDSRDPASRLDQLADPATAARLASTRFHHGDFQPFMDAAVTSQDDFVFLDPPYDSRFSTYDGNGFTKEDHARLARSMVSLPCRWMMVVGDTDFVRDTYCSLPGTVTREFTKGYASNIKGRFERKATHLMIMNYIMPGIR